MHDAIRVDGHPVRFGERDSIAIEGESLAPPEGMNAELEYVREQVAAQLEEHHPLGHHDTPQIARIFIDARWVNGEYLATAHCYSRGVYSTSVVKINWLSGGYFELEILEGVPASTNYRVADVSILRHIPLAGIIGSPVEPVYVRLESVVSASTLRLQRFQGLPGSVSLTDGDFQILIYAESVP